MRETLETVCPGEPRAPRRPNRGWFVAARRSTPQRPAPAGKTPLLRPRSPWALLIVGLAALPFALIFDPIFVGWQVGQFLPGDLRRALHLTEAFGHGVGVVVIGLAIGMAIPRARRAAFAVVALALLAGLAADCGKLFVARVRPLALKTTDRETARTFGRWLPLGRNDSRMQSFPSAHTATAVAFAMGLGQLFPRARRLFIALAAAVAVQRVALSSHYVGDVLAGACIGCVVAMAGFRWSERAGGWGLPAWTNRWSRSGPSMVVQRPRSAEVLPRRSADGRTIRIDVGPTSAI